MVKNVCKYDWRTDTQLICIDDMYKSYLFHHHMVHSRVAGPRYCLHFHLLHAGSHMRYKTPLHFVSTRKFNVLFTILLLRREFSLIPNLLGNLYSRYIQSCFHSSSFDPPECYYLLNFCNISPIYPYTLSFYWSPNVRV